MLKVLSLRAAFAAGLAFVVSSAHATFLPITKADFSSNVTNSFTYETVTYSPPNNMPNHLLTTNFSNNEPVFDSASGAATGGTVKANGYNLNNNGVGGYFRDSRDFTAGNAPSGPAGYLSIDGNTVTTSSLDQTLTGTPFAPFTQYTLTVTVFDRGSGASDKYSLPGNIKFFFTDGGTNITTSSTQTLVNPAAGGKSTGTLVYTTGAVAPTGDVGFRFRISQFQAGAGIVASQAVFDEVTIDAVAVPEPTALSLLGFAGLLARRRRMASI